MPDPTAADPIAIIGIGCRLPGGATDARSFWEMLMGGVDAIREVPQERWDHRFYYDPEPGKPGKTYSKWAGLIDEIDTFDASFFGITQREAPFIDPQQRLLLEATWEALMDAGQQVDIVKGEDTGVFVGISTHDYGDIQQNSMGRGLAYPHSATGVAASIAANRISYALNFQGPSVAVDTACSSSMVAVHMACQALWNKECHRAIAAGVNCIITAYPFVAFSSMGMLSPDGRCKAFDASANGFVRGEGVGAVCLKPLSAALRDGDPVYAVIRSTAVNQDGRTSGMTVPSRGSQQELIATACRLAGVAPHEIQYAEAHGTGTTIGDLIEGSALGTILGVGRQPGDDCLLGSVKTNIGHLEAGSGIAGLIKAALCLKHGMVPPNLHFNTPNPSLNFERLRLKVPVVPTPLKQDAGHRLLACINSFGFGGTNAHAILEAPPSPAPRETVPLPRLPGEKPELILPLSARGSDAALLAVAQSFRTFLESADESLSLQDICAAASRRRTHHEFRLAAVAATRPGMISALSAFLTGEQAPGLNVGQPVKNARLVFVFSGQGPQWWAMGRELLEQEPVFRATIQTCHEELLKLGGCSLLDELQRDEKNTRLNETQIAQTALFALQVALAALWQSWGIRPYAVVGHSMGEVAAAHVCGALSLPEAVRVIHHRGRCMEKTPLRGKMIAAALTRSEAEALIAPYGSRASLAAVNGHKMVSISGDSDAVDEIFHKVEQRQLFVRYVPVNYAFHSSHMDPVREELAESLAGLQPQPGRVKIYSTVTGRLAEGTDYDTGYWWQNVRQSVLFAPAIDAIIAAGQTHFLEISPHPVLSNSMSECLAEAETSGLVLPSLRRQKPERATLLGTLGALHVNGHEVDWAAVYPQPSSALRLPEYPWQKERFWNEPALSKSLRTNPPCNPLTKLRLQNVHPAWETALNKSVLTWLKDHRVGQHLIFPGAGYVEMALAAGHELHPDKPVLIEELEIHRGCILPAGDDVPLLQISCLPDENTFVIQSTLTEDSPAWMQHVTGRIRAEPERKQPAAFDLAAIKQRCVSELDGQAFYQSAATAELHYGPQFQGLTHVWAGPDEALGRIELPSSVMAEMDRYIVHPALLDACIHPTIAIPADGLYLPARMERVRCYSKPGAKVWAYVRRTQAIAKKIIVIDLFILDDAGNVQMEITGFLCKHTAMGSAPGSGPQADWLYQSEWQLKPLTALPAAQTPADYLPGHATLAAQLRDSAAHFSTALGINARYQEWEPRFLQLCRSSILAVFKQLGWRPKAGETITLPALLKRTKVQPAHQRYVQRLLTLLEPDGWLQPQPSAGTPAWTVTAKPASVNRDKIWQDLVFHFPAFHPELMLLDRCTDGLADMLRGKRDAAGLLSAGTLEHFAAASVFTRVYNHLIGEAVTSALARLPEGRSVRILEVGSGTGGVTASVLPRLPSGVEYCFTDVSDRGFEQAAKKFSEYPCVRYRVLDLDLPPEEQGFAGERFDLILASNALSLTRDVQKSLRHARQMLASEGMLMVLETDRSTPWHDLVLGTDARWWHFQDTALRANHPLLPATDWQQILTAADFSQIETVADAANHSSSSQVILLARGPELPQPAVDAAPTAGAGQWLIFADQQGLGHKLADSLRQQGDDCLVVTAADTFTRLSANEFTLRASEAEDHARLLSELPQTTPLSGVVHLWSLDAPAGENVTTAELAQSQTLVCHSPLYLVQALNAAGRASLPGLWFVTRGAQPAGEKTASLALTQAPLHGMARVIMSEHPDLQCRTVDLDASPGSQDGAILLNELLRADAEAEIAWRGEARYVHRLVHGSLDQLAQTSPAALTSEQCFRLESAKPGSLDKLVFRAKPRRAPGPNEVEIEICAAALNFRDVMKALGIYPAEASDAMLLGDECAGRIVRVGSGVTQFKPGDEVMALAAGCFGTHVTTVEHAVMTKPGHLTMEEAATMMVTYLTAAYALSHQGRMTKGERVLIHAATGGVGQAAVRIAKATGAEIFATAGSAEKRAFLKKIGVEHVLDSRTLAFAEEIMRITKDEGIDLVLNSLAGEAIHQSLSLLRQYGRFLEIGKRDIYGNTKVGLFAFRKNLSYHAIDLGHALDPRNSKPLMSSLKKLFTSRRLPALPYRTFALSDAAHAFRYITQARQIGKVVLTMADAKVSLSTDVPDTAFQLNPEATYLVAGGLGGFGLAMSQWLVEKGARHIVLSSRSGASTDEARAGVAAMQAAGAEVTVIQSDVSDPTSVASLLKEIAQSHPPLRGVSHVAMVLDDGLISQLNAARFQKVTTPKINGAWNLHAQTKGLELDHFVMFSSVASIIGSPGQANYAAANAFLDALANHRRMQGLPALTINWGVMAGVGYVARHKKLEEHFARIGWSGLTPAETLPILGRLMQQPAISQMMVSRIDWSKWATVTPAIIATPRYALLTTEDALRQHQSDDANWLREAVLSAAPADQLGILETFLREQVAKILRTSPAKIDSKRPLNEIGIDSLMAVELIHQIESQTGIAIPTGQLMGGAPTAMKLAEILLSNLTGSKSQPASSAQDSPALASAEIDLVQDADLSRWSIPFAPGHVSAAQIEEPQNIFFTGALEFLGAYLLRDLLHQTTATVYCLLGASDVADAAQQIEAHLKQHGCWEESFRARIIPVLGDLALPLLGLEPSAFDQLATTLDVIHHTAAHINHIAAYAQLRTINVKGSVEIIRLAAQGRLKPVHYLSSSSVLAAGDATEESKLREDSPLPCHEKLMVGYSQSRWVSEQLFIQARAHGLPVHVYRPGLLVGDDQTGICPTDNIIWLFLKTCIATGVGPDSGYSSLLTPVDFVAAAIVRLSLKLTGYGRTYHLINPAAPDFRELLALARACGYSIREVPEIQWEEEISRSGLSAHQNPVAAYQLFIPRQVLANLVRERSADFFHNTLQDLQDTGIGCPPLDQPRMKSYLQHLASTGFIPPPASPLHR